MSDVVELAKRRGFFFQSTEAYGGVAGFYTYGPAGAALKRNVEDAWRDRFAVQEGHMEVDAPTVMPEPVFDASGHLDTFDDMLVECPECGESHRADHLVEDETAIEDAESFSPAAIAEIIVEEDLLCPSCGAPLEGQPVEEFNLMFETAIGPGDDQPGYLRPETAQGIFVEFPRLKEYAREQLPFGVTQIGRAYRNEISPRNAIVRVRELTQAELELFVDPETDEPPLERVADVVIPIYPAPEAVEATVDGERRTFPGQQADDGEPVEMTVREAVDAGVIENPWVAYYVGLARRWYERIGVDPDRLRFRQHQAGERAHYAVDCWDAEADVSPPGEAPDWIELAGIAYRGDYDLSKHDEHSDDAFTLFKQFDEPVTTDEATVDPDMSYLGPEYGDRAADIAEALAELATRDPAAFDGEEVTVEVSHEETSGPVTTYDHTYTIPTEKTGFRVEEVTRRGYQMIPHVVEPSFGVDRAVYTALVHALDTDEVDGEPRQVLRLEPAIAPTTVAVFPLMDRDGMGERARDLAADLRSAGLSVAYDDSGNIGRRYRRQDEVGTPYCVTVDYETIEEGGEAFGTVTVRDRDSTEQVRVPVDGLADVLVGLRDGELAFEDLPGEY